MEWVCPALKRMRSFSLSDFDFTLPPALVAQHPATERSGSRLLEGWQLRYIYFIDPECRKRLTVPEIPFSKIDEIGAGMYKGEKIPLAQRHKSE